MLMHEKNMCDSYNRYISVFKDITWKGMYKGDIRTRVLLYSPIINGGAYIDKGSGLTDNQD